MKPMKLLYLLPFISLIGCGTTHGIDIRQDTTNFTPPVIQGTTTAHDSIIFQYVPVMIHDTVTTDGVHDTVIAVRKAFGIWTDTLVTDHGDTLTHLLNTYTRKVVWRGVQQAYKVQHADTTHWDKPADIVKFGFFAKLGLGASCFFIGALLGALALALLIAFGKITLPKL